MHWSAEPEAYVTSIAGLPPLTLAFCNPRERIRASIAVAAHEGLQQLRTPLGTELGARMNRLRLALRAAIILAYVRSLASAHS